MEQIEDVADDNGIFSSQDFEKIINEIQKKNPKSYTGITPKIR